MNETHTAEQIETLVAAAPAVVEDPHEWAATRIDTYDTEPACPECGMGPAGLLSDGRATGRLVRWTCRHCSHSFTGERR
jgi:rubredoxin